MLRLCVHVQESVQGCLGGFSGMMMCEMQLRGTRKHICLLSTDDEIKRIHINSYMDVKKEAKKGIRSKREANEVFGRKINDDPNENKNCFQRK